MKSNAGHRKVLFDILEPIPSGSTCAVCLRRLASVVRTIESENGARLTTSTATGARKRAARSKNRASAILPPISAVGGSRRSIQLRGPCVSRAQAPSLANACLGRREMSRACARHTHTEHTPRTAPRASVLVLFLAHLSFIFFSSFLLH